MKKDRYRYYTHKREDGATEIIAVSSYAGRKVKGKAVCSPDDKFDEEIGKKLAKLRCDVKVDEKRVKRASEERDFYMGILCELEFLLDKNEEYLSDSLDRLLEDEDELTALLEELE